MIFSATDDGSRASIQTDDPASRRCAPDSRLVSAPNIGLAHPALALLLLAGLAAPVQAATFVSNIGQTDAGFIGTTLEQDVSQGFTTGSSGAILTSIEIKMDTSFVFGHGAGRLSLRPGPGRSRDGDGSHEHDDGVRCAHGALGPGRARRAVRTVAGVRCPWDRRGGSSRLACRPATPTAAGTGSPTSGDRRCGRRTDPAAAP